MRRWVRCLALALLFLCSPVHADLVLSLKGPESPTDVSSYTLQLYYTYPGNGSGIQYPDFPQSLHFYCLSSWELQLMQTHFVLDNQLVERASPLVLVDITGGGSQYIYREFGLTEKWWDGVSSDPKKAAGRFIWRLTDTTRQVVESESIFTMMTPPANSGGVPAAGNPSDPNSTNSNSSSWWGDLFESLFVPDQVKINEWRSALLNWQTWGPFGVWNILHGTWETEAGEDSFGSPVNPNHGMSLPFPTPWGLFSIDLEPYEYWINMVRLFISGGLWITVSLGLYRRVGGHVVQS